MARILIVDDSETVRVQLRKLLEANGHTVSEETDGQNGLDRLRADGQVDLIICDVNMPNMDGLTMVSHARQLESLSSVPIFMLTTESSPELKTKGKAAGVRAWVLKPFQPETLLTAIGKVLQAPAAKPGSSA